MRINYAHATVEPAMPKRPVAPAAASTHGIRQIAATYDVASPKRPTNVSINEDLLAQARDLGVNLSQTLEDALSARVREEKRRRWLEQNREAIAECNSH